jgi:DnaK suppressor protein
MRAHQIKQRLLEHRHHLVARYFNELGLVTEELDSREIEAIENASEQWDARVLTRLSEVDRMSLTKIVDALKRLEAGSYGQCVECRERIAPSRLQALSEAETCYECARDAERPTPA